MSKIAQNPLMKKLLACALSFCCGISFSASGQSIRTAFLSPPGVIRITNDSLQKNNANIVLDWQLLVNGLSRQKGSVPGLLLIPGHSRTLRLPLHLPTGGEEAFLKVDYRGPVRSRPAIVSQMVKCKPWGGDISMPAAGELSFTDSNDVFTVTSPGLHLQFDKQTGWILQYEAGHLLLLADTNALRPAVTGSPHLQLFSTSTGSQMVIVRTEYTLPEISCLLHLSYTVNAAGAMLVEQTVETDTSRRDSLVHPIEAFGMTWRLPPGLDSIAWYGLTTGSDTGDIPAIHHGLSSAAPDHNPGTSAPDHRPVNLSSSVMVRWWTITGPDGRGFQLTADSNCLRSLSVTQPADSALLRLYPLFTQLQLDDVPASPHTSDVLASPQASYVHYHYAYKVTPIATIMDHPAVKKIDPR